MGHASLRMTLDVYAKWIDKADRGRERDRASVAFGRAEFATNLPPRRPRSAQALITNNFLGEGGIRTRVRVLT
jgi:hypothetical protein